MGRKHRLGWALSRMRLSVLRWRDALVHRFNTSLRLRVMVTTLSVASLLVIVIGIAFFSLIGSRLLSAKLDVAQAEIDRARITVERQIAATDPSATIASRLATARAALTNRSAQEPDTQAVFDAVLQVRTETGNGVETVTAPEGYRIPTRLANFVAENQVSYQYSTLHRTDGTSTKVLIIGTPTNSDIPGLDLYLVMPLEAEETTMRIMRRMLLGAGAVLILVLGLSLWGLTQQVTSPMRSASRIAERFASGHFRERMVVQGEDEMARLAISFNSMAESLEKQIRQLEEYGDLQRQFTSDVSHEIRTPLTTVRGAADLLYGQSDQFDAAGKRAAELMVAQLDRFQMLIDDLLEISRHDAGQAELSTAEVDLCQAIRSAYDDVERIAEELHIPVIFTIPDEPVMVEIDIRRVERILRNLMANAIDHADGKPVEVTVSANAEAVAVAVVDHGVGLKPGDENLVFNRFWRADPSRKRHSGGTGLGLAISLEDAHLHGGTISAIGRPGRGTMFLLELPRTPGGSYPEAPAELSIPRPMSRTDAERIRRQLLGRMLPVEAPAAGTTAAAGYTGHTTDAESINAAVGSNAARTGSNAHTGNAARTGNNASADAAKVGAENGNARGAVAGHPAGADPAGNGAGTEGSGAEKFGTEKFGTEKSGTAKSGTEKFGSQNFSAGSAAASGAGKAAGSAATGGGQADGLLAEAAATGAPAGTSSAAPAAGGAAEGSQVGSTSAASGAAGAGSVAGVGLTLETSAVSDVVGGQLSGAGAAGTHAGEAVAGGAVGVDKNASGRRPTEELSDTQDPAGSGAAVAGAADFMADEFLEDPFADVSEEELMAAVDDFGEELPEEELKAAVEHHSQRDDQPREDH